MASRIARLIRRPVSTLLLIRGYGQVRNFSHHIVPGGPVSSKSLKEVGYLQKASPYQLWSRSFASDNGDQVDAVVPFMGESITDGTLAAFLKKPGDHVEVDETIAQIETDKVTIDVASPEAGIIEKFVAKEGDTVVPGTKVAVISKSGSSISKAPSTKKSEDVVLPSPPAEKEVVEKKKSKAEASKAEKPKAPSPAPPKSSATEPQLPPKERERRVPMTRLRKRVATRLKDSQNTFAMLTTFNEVDMTNLMKLRSDYKYAFFEKHGVKLGLMSGFVKGAVSGLQNQPIVNAVIDSEDIIYREYIDISIAIGTPKKTSQQDDKEDADVEEEEDHHRDLETWNKLSRTSLWFTTRFSKKKKVWVDSTSQKVYDELKRLESQPPEEGTPPMTEDQRFEAVLRPERSGYIRGCGARPKPKTSTVGQRIHAQLERENEEFRRRAEADTRRLELLEKENSEMASRMESLESQLASQQTQVQAQVQAALHSQVESQQTQVHAQVQAALQSQLNILLQQFKESGQIPM